MMYNERIPGALYTYFTDEHILRRTQDRRNPSTCSCLIRASLRIQYSDSVKVAEIKARVGEISVRVHAAWQAWHFSRLEVGFGTSAS